MSQLRHENRKLKIVSEYIRFRQSSEKERHVFSPSSMPQENPFENRSTAG